MSMLKRPASDSHLCRNRALIPAVGGMAVAQMVITTHAYHAYQLRHDPIPPPNQIPKR
jgi:hypothetical protein